MKKTALNLLSLAVGFAVALLMAEGISAFFLPPSHIQKLPLLRMQADPSCGYRYRANQKGYTLESPVRVNSWGFRGPDWNIKKNPEVVRVALLGDSYIFGQGVGDDETAAAQLEKKLNASAEAGERYEVLNFGMSGYDSGHELGVLKKYVLDFQPDVVVLHFFINDLFYIKNFDFYPTLFAEEERKFSPLRWHVRNAIRRSRLAMYLWDLLKSPGKDEVLQAIRAYAVEGKLPAEGPAREGWEFTKARLVEFGKLAGEKKFKAVFAVIPTPEELQQARSAPYTRYLLDESRNAGVTPLDIANDFTDGPKESWEKWLIPYDYHFNPEGNRILSEALFKAVKGAAGLRN